MSPISQKTKRTMEKIPRTIVMIQPSTGIHPKTLLTTPTIMSKIQITRA